MQIEQIVEFLTENWYIPLVFAACIIYTIILWIVARKKSLGYAKKYPNAVRVYLTGKGNRATIEPVTVHAVDGGKKKNTFTDGLKTGFYLLPGTHTVDMEYSYTRPGILHKTVTKSTGVVHRELCVEENKTYMLRFDRKEKEFVFEEI
jgi:hypothetical protein